jgi:hypothetical protein
MISHPRFIREDATPGSRDMRDGMVLAHREGEAAPTHESDVTSLWLRFFPVQIVGVAGWSVNGGRAAITAIF